MNRIHSCAALAALVLSGCGENLPAAPGAGGEGRPESTQSVVEPTAHTSLNDDEFKAALAPWLPALGNCELTLKDEGRGATYDSQEPIVGPFPYGSISKTFTAVLVMKLVELGHLNLGDKLSKFQMAIPGDDEITIKDLLTHTSGLPDYFYNVNPAIPAKPGQILEMIRRAAKGGTLTRGEFHYSNTNYELLSEVCTQVGGASFADLLKQYVCQPLNLISQPWRIPTFDLNWYGGAGSIAGSIQDLATFGEAIAVQDKRLLSPASWKLLTSPHVPMQATSQYGFGVIVAPMSVYSTLSHGGTIPASGGVAPFVSMLIVRPGGFNPVSFAAPRRVEWDPQSTNALYGAFACTCAALDLKRWIATFCLGPSAKELSKYVSSGEIGSGLGNLLSHEALKPLKDRIGEVKSFMVQTEGARSDTVIINGTATGSAGSITIHAQFGPGGRLDSFGMK